MVDSALTMLGVDYCEGEFLGEAENKLERVQATHREGTGRDVGEGAGRAAAHQWQAHVLPLPLHPHDNGATRRPRGPPRWGPSLPRPPP